MLFLLAQNQSSGAGAAAGLGVFMILWMILGVVAFIFWLWMLIDVLGSSLPTNEKILWALIICILPILGPLLYFLLKRSGSRRAAP
jgi:hypothetical protein